MGARYDRIDREYYRRIAVTRETERALSLLTSQVGVDAALEILKNALTKQRESMSRFEKRKGFI